MPHILRVWNDWGDVVNRFYRTGAAAAAIRRVSPRVVVLLAMAVIAVVATLSGLTQRAEALPSFARQTGQPCGKCHTDFPALTPFGRRFKLLGYTIGGGEYRTTLFPSANDSKAAVDNARGYAKALPPAAEPEKEYVPPISMMAIVGFTHTTVSLPPPTDPFKGNDNVILSPLSFFWGGAITDNIGAFAQVTYTGPPAGGFADPFGHTWTWDNTDVRYAKSTKLGDLDAVLGITANNNPSVQDVWNTTPAWSFPYAASTIAPTPSTKTIIEGAFAAHVGGVGAYAFLNDMLYLEVTGYKTLNFSQQNALGVDPFGAPGLIDNVAPYWRAAIEPHWDNHNLMIGTFGMHTEINPWIDPTFALGSMGTFAQTDKFTDVGFDAQYQYQGDDYWLTLRGSFIHETQRLDATFANGGSANQTNDLNSLKLQGSLAYGGDNKIVLTGQYFDIWGSSDPILFAGLASGDSPNSSGFTAEAAYIPFGVTKAPGWPWANARVGLQYTWYNKFDGTTVGASDHNTLFLHLWMAM